MSSDKREEQTDHKMIPILSSANHYLLTVRDNIGQWRFAPVRFTLDFRFLNWKKFPIWKETGNSREMLMYFGIWK